LNEELGDVRDIIREDDENGNIIFRKVNTNNIKSDEPILTLLSGKK